MHATKYIHKTYTHILNSFSNNVFVYYFFMKVPLL